MKKLLAVLLVLWAGGALGYMYYSDASTQRVAFRTTPIRRGDLQATITSTGTIEPEETVNVGAQIAGEVQSFGKDPHDPSRSITYGSHVEQGTVLAHLDDALYKSRVNQARADVAKAEADVEQAKVRVEQTARDLDRKEELRKKGRQFVSGQELDDTFAAHETAKAALVVIRSTVDVAKARLEEANVNLRYTTITSPVKGVILDRRVNIGQTLVASLNAPSLFLIAKDLSKMEIWASVNETDVGAIHVGQPVRFTVGAFPREEFRGRVSQVRLNASMTSGVVTYTVVVGVDNAGGKLMPYLTARLQFEVEKRQGVQLVPNAALRWQPKPALIAPEFQAELPEIQRRRHAASEGDKPRSAPGSESGRGIPGVLWVRRGDEFVKPIKVDLGLTDGVNTEILSGDLKDVSEVVIGLDQRDDKGEGVKGIYDPNKFKSKKK